MENPFWRNFQLDSDFKLYSFAKKEIFNNNYVQGVPKDMKRF